MPASKRLITHFLLVLAGASVPVVVGAATPNVEEGPKEFELGRLGKHRLLENSLIFDYQGEIFVLRYEEWPIKEKLGTVSFHGSIIAAPLREELLRLNRRVAGFVSTPPQEDPRQEDATPRGALQAPPAAAPAPATRPRR